MSGYDDETGIFELNESKASRYLRVPKDSTIKAEDWRVYCAELFRRAGFDVLRQTPYGIDLVADDGDVFEVLSGQKATWGRATPSAKVTYEKWQRTREWFNATDLGKELSPKLGPVKVNRLLETLGYQTRSEGVWKPTTAASGMYELRDGAQLYGNRDQKILIWHRRVIDVLQPNL